MAKTISLALTSNSVPSQLSLPGPSVRPRRRTPRTKSATPYLAPSSGVLSFLATIAASSPVHGSPAPPPPSFLCPSLDAENAPTLASDHQPSSSIRKSTIYPRSSATQKRLASRSVPDKFEPGDDGTWRKVESYTLYGSTVCPSCREPTNAVSSVDDQMQDSSDVEPTIIPSASYDISDSLPQGWKPLVVHAEGRTPLILALSLALAFSICFFIIGCLFWRKNIRRKFKEAEDVEMKARRRSRSEEDPTEQARLIAEKDAKVKQKLWARATARWKANARYSARQRRGKRPASIRSLHANNSTASLEHHHSQEESSSARSSRQSSPSRSSSRRSSIDNRHEDSLPDTQGIQPPPESESLDNIPIISLSPPNVSHSSPPAYQRGQILHIPLEGLAASDSERSKYSPSFSSAPHSPSLYPSRPHSRRPSHTSLYTPSIGTELQLEPDTYESPLHSAHVAIDDKTVLARLADLASSPGSDNFVEPSNPQSSAPEWHDEEFDDFSRHRDSPVCRSRSSSPVGLFPPPPSKGKMAAADYLEYLPTFEEEMSALEPEEPSAPPFEADISSDHEALAPSAPPLQGDEDITEYASAPAWDSPPDVHQDQQSRDRHSNDEPSREEWANTSPTSRTVEGPVTLDGNLPDYLP